jgi:hypothetical protein
VKPFIEIFKHLCACNNPDIQFRAFYIVRNIVKANKDLAARIVETELMDILFAIKEIKDDKITNEKVKSNFRYTFVYQLNFRIEKSRPILSKAG